MANTIQIKRNSTANATPAANQLSAGELAINTADGRLFAKNSAGTVVNLPVTSISGQTITPDKVTAASGAGLGTSANPANFGIAGCKLLTRGDAFIGNADGTAGVHVGVVAANTWDNTAASVYFEGVNEAVTQYKPMILTTGFFPQLSLATSGKIGVGTANPQTNFQVITSDYYYDSANAVYTPTTSTLFGAGQSEILQVIAGGATYDSENDVYVPTEYVNLARFHVNDPSARGSFSLSNSGTGAWENNVMQFFIHGTDYAPGYYGGNASDAGCAMIVTQGSDIQKLQIGNYNSAPIEFFTGNTKRFNIRASDGNFDIYTDIQTDFTPGAAFVWNNTYDPGAGPTGELAAIQVITGSASDQGTLAFYTGPANAIVEQVRIDQDGNLGVGTGTPSQKLHVVGTALVSKIIVGASSAATGTSAASISGDNNTASASYATAAGYQAVADRYGVVSHASGRFAADGDAQAIRATLRNSTTNATPTTLFLDGSSTRLTIPSGKALFVTVQISGIINGGSKSAHYVRKVAIKNVAGTTALIGTVSTVGTDVEDDAAYDVAITADNTNDALQINVTGKAAETIRWVALVDGTEIKYG